MLKVLILLSNSKILILFIVLLSGAIIASCRKDTETIILSNPSEYSSWLPDFYVPDDNAPTLARFKLGKKLFYDKNLSSDRTISCSSCHKPELGFADNKSITPGVEGRLGFRNAPTLINVAYQERLFMEGGIPNLELQALAPLEDHVEMNLNVNEATKRLLNDPTYVELSFNAYDREPSPYVIVRALSVFQRQIIASNSPWEQTIYNNKDEMTQEQLRGWEVFKTSSCNSCHTGPNLTDQQYHNIGLYENYEDYGRERVSIDTNDRGKFKTPTLRNIMQTAPYMHDGSLLTIDEVIAHFESGGVQHPNKSSLITPKNWTLEDKKALKAFFYSLTDTKYIDQMNLK